MVLQRLANEVTAVVTTVCAAAADLAIAVTDTEAQVDGECAETSRIPKKEAAGTTVRAQGAEAAVPPESQSRENTRARSAATRSIPRRRSTRMAWCVNIVGKSCKIRKRSGNTRSHPTCAESTKAKVMLGSLVLHARSG